MAHLPKLLHIFSAALLEESSLNQTLVQALVQTLRQMMSQHGQALQGAAQALTGGQQEILQRCLSA